MENITRNAGVYKITCTVNGKIYVGSSINVYLRISAHISTLNKGTHYNKPLQKAWNEFKSKSFTFETIEECEAEIVLQREQFWLDYLQPYDETGFNLATKTKPVATGRRLIPRSREWSQNISNSKRGKPSPRKGKMHTPESKEKIKTARSKQIIPPRSAEVRARQSEIMKGKQNALGNKHTPEEIAKISASKIGKKRKPFSEEWRKKLGEASKGRVISEEQKQAISRANKGRIVSPETRAKISATKKAKNIKDE